MGVVYEVEHAQLGVRYALKVFPFEGQKGEFLRKRFVAEGKILARLSVPGVVRVYDMGTTETFAWFTMDCVLGADGEPHTLADVPQTGESPEDTVIGWYEDVRRALEGVHAAGVVHRDVKLENVLIDSEGKAILGDLGISCVKDAATSSEATPATDCYALGVAFFRLLTGTRYEPGPHAFDLLAPFDKRWREVLGALLVTDSAKRTLMPFRRPRRQISISWVGFLFGFVITLAVGAGLHFCRVQPKMPIPLREGDAQPVFAETKKVASAEALPQRTLALTNGVTIDMIQCPAGHFTMGKVFADQLKAMGKENDPKAAAAAAPACEVTISRPFWMSKSPITWGQFKTVTGTTSWDVAGPLKLGDLKWPKRGEAVQAMGGDKSMFFGNLVAAERFLVCMNRVYADLLPAGMVFRLASEAEWEYALLAGHTEIDNPFAKILLNEDDEKQLGASFLQWRDFLKHQDLAPELPPEGTPYGSGSSYDVFFLRLCPAGIPGMTPPNDWGFHDFRTVDEWTLDVVSPIDKGESTWQLLQRLAAKQPPRMTDPLAHDVSHPAKRGLMRMAGRKPFDRLELRGTRNNAVHFAAFRLVIGPDLVMEQYLSPRRAQQAGIK
ncbi:MAG: bifunctional serine/threonine-protein kinase/formylglycine-generating enzyme family protein [Kiritimatiellae bacterium]|nr:bifunctional serine/threonine-protein kinase/formylglycine-generating enzyme family protein [Kiritimatiellia bacterium]